MTGYIGIPLYFNARNKSRPAAAMLPMASTVVGSIAGSEGMAGASLLAGVISVATLPSGNAAGDTATGFPHDAPEASGGAERISFSVIGGVVGQPGE